MYYTESGYSFKEDYAFSYPVTFAYLENKIKGKNITDFFVNNNMKSIAICIRGVSNNLGELLCNDIIKSGIQVKYFIDKNYYNIFSGGILGVPVIKPEDLSGCEPVDAYIVASIVHFNEIANDLMRSGIEFDRIISLTDIVFSVQEGIG